MKCPMYDKCHRIASKEWRKENRVPCIEDWTKCYFFKMEILDKICKETGYTFVGTSGTWDPWKWCSTVEKRYQEYLKKYLKRHT